MINPFSPVLFFTLRRRLTFGLAFWALFFLLNAASSRASFLGRKSLETASFELFEEGDDPTINYENFGHFNNLGGEGYRFVVEDPEGLARAVGEGIYPNTKSVRKDPDFQRMNYKKELEGNHWDFVHVPDLQKSFFKWAVANEEPGVKQYFTAFALERAGLFKQALKAYHACLIHFPKSYGITYWNTPWYVGPTALDRMEFILESHPELKLKLVGAEIFIKNGFDNKVQDDVVVCNPGKLIKASGRNLVPPRVNLAKMSSQTVFNGERVDLLKFKNGDWRLNLDGNPFPIRAIAYQPNPVGKSPDNGTLKPTEDFWTADINGNGRADGPYDAWVDKNNNGIQDKDEPAVGDLKLMKDMGVNTLRVYHHCFNRALLDDAYNNYGFHVLMGDLLGAYTVGSGADWYKGTDYTDPGQLQNMRASVKKMVLEYKDHPAVLMWVLGNENVYGPASNAPQKPKEFFTFADEVAKWIKSVDPNHPVAISNGDLLYFDQFAEHSPNIDIFACNAYRGDHGFGRSLWESVKRESQKPVFISEYGCPAMAKGKSAEEAETLQAEYIKNCWSDIEKNMAGGGKAGNSLGGVLFTWVDEWWKAGTPPQFDPAVHDTVGQWQGPFPDGWMYEEWLGVTSQGNGQHSPFLRQLRKAYYVFQEMWNPVKESKIRSRNN